MSIACATNSSGTVSPSFRCSSISLASFVLLWCKVTLRNASPADRRLTPYSCTNRFDTRRELDFLSNLSGILILRDFKIAGQLMITLSKLAVLAYKKLDEINSFLFGIKVCSIVPASLEINRM